ncbi:hypothetical protein BDV29DRAFT_199363 [Aspergillus leporis]|uniref:Uncharacterized protein n=1 Tax=Aspergillus leporis TaxID=41062 RepID=A0A5N5WLE7_9EURO|nr:hypothetical protein BDV29DRAFT_199363 [Aspergillus leporis]
MKFRYQPSYTVNRFPLGKYTSQSETPISVDDQYDFSKDQEQTHVTAASTVMANMVGFCIRICLAAAFTQCFWHLVRITPMRLKTLRYLYSMRGSAMSFFSLTVLQKGWLLVTITTIIRGIPIAMSVPSSAMTAWSAMRTVVGSETEVFGTDLSDVSRPRWPGRPRAMGCTNQTSLQHLALETMVNGALRTMSSPCGLNCSYELSFDGPYLSCSSTSIEKASEPSNQILLWFEVFKILNAEAESFVRNDSTDTVSFQYTSNVLICRPRQVRYHVVQEFHNGEQQQHNRRCCQQIHDRNVVAFTMAINKPLIRSYYARAVGIEYELEPVSQDAAFLRGINNTIVQSTQLFSTYSDGLSADTIMGAKTLFTFQLWSTTTNVTRHELHTQFVFSRPLNLLLPYFISLGVTLPSVTIQFGELTRPGGSGSHMDYTSLATDLRMTGFGPKDGVAPLMIGKRYGKLHEN